ncbi:MAG: PilZ domain-containing protein [Thermodesulfobacteriota bacterium]
MKHFLKRVFTLKHRKHKRYHVQEGLTVAIEPESFPGDQIVNIGLGGLTFNRVDRGQPLSDRFMIDLLLDGKLYLEKLKVKLVSNIEVGDISYSSKNIRRISVQFVNLTPVQEFDVKALIKSHGIEEV